MAGKLFIVSAPSGTGKTSLVNALVAKLGGISRIVTYTSKKPRKREQHGCDYHFISEEEFKLKIKQNFFLEWSQCYGHYYGSPQYIIEHIKDGKSYILVIDRFGTQQIIKHMKEAILIWIHPPTMLILEQRLRERETETEEQIQRRLILAQQELEVEQNNPFYHYYVINESFEKALQELEKIVTQQLK